MAYCIAQGLLEYDEVMQPTIIIAAFCTALTSTSVLADFSYDQTSQMTGGFLTKLPGILGGNKLREPQRSTVILKGNRLAHISADHASIIDLDKETITDIRYKEKTYSVMTFAEMKEMMESLQSRKQEAKTPDVEFDIDIKNTGKTKVVSGFNTSETVMTFKMKSTDPRSGKEATMVMVNDMWLAKNIPGYQEIGAFYKRMGERANWMPQGGAGATAGPAASMGAGIQAAMKNAQKMDGVPILQITRMRPEGAEYDSAMAQAGDAQRQQAAAQQQQQPQTTPQQAGQTAAEQSAASAIAGRLGRVGGLAGGLGGLRRKKNDQQDTPPAAPPAQQQTPTPAPAGAAGDSVLMEMTIESSGFSSASVDGAKLEVPGGFKLVQKKTGR